MLYNANIQQSEGGILLVESSLNIERQIVNTGATQVEIRVVDPRKILDEQRKKARAIIRDIALWSGGEDPDYIHMMMKYDFATETGINIFRSQIVMLRLHGCT